MACYTVNFIVTLTRGTQHKHMNPHLKGALTANWRPIVGLTKDRDAHYGPEFENLTLALIVAVVAAAAVVSSSVSY